MMKNKKLVYIVLPLFINLFHALTASAKAMSLPKDSVRISAQADSVKRMMRDGVSLKEVVVSGSSNKEIQMKSALNVVRVNQKFIEENFSGSLMQTLSRLPGVQAMNVGSGESKPVIRGLGFNRVLVAENGIKHEGQQWGDDHGLEIDQYAIDQAEVIKGPASLTYGSDAIGGVINLKSNTMPLKKFAGQVNLFGRTNNESIGSSVRLTGRNGKFWYKANATWMDYADYKVPADSIEYYSYWIKLKDQRLRNTAGREMDGNLMLGYAGDRWNTSFRIADVNAKAGFFANAHGLEVRLRTSIMTVRVATSTCLTIPSTTSGYQIIPTGIGRMACWKVISPTKTTDSANLPNQCRMAICRYRRTPWREVLRSKPSPPT